MGYQGECDPSSRNSQSKGPEAGAWLVRLRSSRETTMAGAEQTDEQPD